MKPSNSSDNNDGTNSKHVDSVEHSFRIVEQLREFDTATLSMLDDTLPLSKSTIHRHLTTLIRNEFVVKTGDEYRLGLRYLDIGGKLRNDIYGSREIKPKIRELAEETDELAQFHVHEHGYVVNIFREAGRRGVFTKVRIGKRQYMHQGAAGKAILAKLPAERVDEILDRHGLPQATPHTITDRETLYSELEEIRDRGVAFNTEETAKGVHTVGAPLMTPDGDVLGSCVVAGPSHRMQGPRFREDLPELIQSVVNELGLNLAHR
jgi:DNA-binding IclR family transcriptional regulator